MSDDLANADVSALLGKIISRPAKADATPAVSATVSELVENVTAKAAETTNPAVAEPSNVSDVFNEGGGTPQQQPQQTEQPQPEAQAFQKKERYTREDYLKLDWSKSNNELAELTGKNPNYIAQLRSRLKSDTSSKPDFSDILPTTEKAAIDYQLMSQTVFDMSTGTLSMVFGPEWQPKDAQERDVMIMSLKAYLTAKQAQDLPPGVILTFVCLAYAAPRFRAPATSQKVKGFWFWLKDKLGKIRKKKPPVLTVIQRREIDATAPSPNAETGK